MAGGLGMQPLEAAHSLSSLNVTEEITEALCPYVNGESGSVPACQAGQSRAAADLRGSDLSRGT